MDFVIKPVPKMVEESVSRHGRKTALMYPAKGNYEHITYDGMWKRTDNLSAGLVNLGLENGKRIAMVTENRPESPISEIATEKIKSIFVPLYERRSKDDIAYILNDCGASGAVVLEPNELKKIKDMRGTLPELQYLITLDGEGNYSKNIIPFSEVMKLGDKKERDLVNELYSSLSLEDLAKIIYTSGTTGEPKGVLLDHLAIAYNALASKERLGVNENDTTISYLPLAHSLEANNQNVMLISGGMIAYSKKEEMVKNMSKVKPTILAGVPRVFEKIYNAIPDFGKEAMEKYAGCLDQSKNPDIVTKIKILGVRYGIPLVKPGLKKITGGNIRFFISGGAPLDPELSRYFEILKLPIVEGYGLTENSPVVSVNHPDKIKHGTVGKKLDLVVGDESRRRHGPIDIRTDKKGLLFVRGPSVMKRYWNKPKETDKVLKSGWLNTEDIVEIDRDGYITITGREKEIVVLSTGENVPLPKIEGLIKKGLKNSEVLVFGDKKPYPVALIFPSDYSVKLDDSYIKKYLDEMNEGLPEYEQIRKFRIMQKPLNENKEMTPTLKVKRGLVEERYKSFIDELYARDV